MSSITSCNVAARPLGAPAEGQRPPSGLALLSDLLTNGVVLLEEWEQLSIAGREELLLCQDKERLLRLVVEHRLLTEYQAERVQAGQTFGLILGHYRVLDQLGCGGMGTVYKAEHRYLRRPVAVKVLSLGREGLLPRFFTEMRAVSQLQHPNIVGALDAGEVPAPNRDAPTLHYFVMEYVPGQDLQERVRAHGPMPLATACALMHQVAGALAEVHRHNLVHRDIKPSNVLVTPDGRAKLLDFGLARRFFHGQTEPGALLGTLDFMAPEQARNPSAVDIRADIYSLGGTLYWCLTGQLPFALRLGLAADGAPHRHPPPPSARARRPDLPAAIDAVLARMMAPDPDDRYPTPQVVMRALLPFLKQEPAVALGADLLTTPTAEVPRLMPWSGGSLAPRVYRVLIVDDEPGLRGYCRRVLQADDVLCEEAADGALALAAVQAQRFDLLLLDIDLPQLTGPQVLQRLLATPPGPHLKIIMCSGRASLDEMAQMLLVGADDYLAKPFSDVQLRARVRAALRLKDAQDRSDLLNRHLLAVNHEMEQNLSARDCDLVHARNALVLALAELVAHRDTETGEHLVRLQRYCRTLAEQAANLPGFAEQIDANFVQMLECCVPLHDIGKVGLPDHILLNQGKYTADERIIMQTHAVMGAETLQKVARRHGFALAFLQTAIDITRHHHERYDGSGYPDRLAGSDIPLAARLVAVADVYDALRSRRAYRPRLAHDVAVKIITESPGQFDPGLLRALGQCAAQFERIYGELPD
jgi:response regulator RpfG family c-di-GMP phosphodiesterase